MTTFMDKIVGELGDKRRWRQYKARVRALPVRYRTSVKALGRYLTHFGVITKVDVLMSMLDDLVDLFERAAADRTPVGALVGEAPAEFAETFFRNYSNGRWSNKGQDPSVSAIEREIHRGIEREMSKERDRLVKAVGRDTADAGTH